jgi:hypothetical protein
MLKTVDIKGKKYVEVNERLKFFRTEEKYKDYSLESEIIELANGVITIKAIIKDGNGVVKATGLAQEKESSSFINKTSFVENCETSAWGRALGNLGIGIDTSVATADEVRNAINNQENTVEVDNDTDIFEGLKACSAYSELSAYYKKNFPNVKDKEAFNQLATKLKAKFKAKEEVKNG